MEIRTDVELAFPIEVVYAAYRDRLTELVPFLPDIRAIAVTTREERPGEVKLVNEWKGGGDIPSVARAFLKESMIAWTDYATWREADHTVLWRTEPHAFPGAITSSGENRYVATSTGTRLELRGELVCDPSKVPGVPRLLARTVKDAVEKLFVVKVGQNAKSIARGMEKLLASG